MRNKLHLAFNAASGAFVRGLTMDALRASIETAGWSLSGETDVTSGAIDPAQMTATDAIAIAGGDGTAMEVLNACADTETPPVLILPCGTANLLARHVHATIDLDAVLENARTAVTKPLELGRANGKTFAVAAAIGVSPSFARLREDMRSDRGWRRIRRIPAYLAAGFRSFFRGQFYANLYDDQAPRRATALYVSCPDSLVKDGCFTVRGGRLRTVADLAGSVAMATGSWTISMPMVCSTGAMQPRSTILSIACCRTPLTATCMAGSGNTARIRRTDLSYM
ncbi:diacylglycerol/lipid kinase family protein [Hyphobacterium sp.]|uniref:diacylglycerol/lipid kinase family protein n=1 Tax=Hyphobacterium sp. TaxID=2004662 RepID=UPI003B51C38B